jgi:hypothetical protein
MQTPSSSGSVTHTGDNEESIIVIMSMKLISLRSLHKIADGKVAIRATDVALGL